MYVTFSHLNINQIIKKYIILTLLRIRKQFKQYDQNIMFVQSIRSLHA